MPAIQKSPFHSAAVAPDITFAQCSTEAEESMISSLMILISHNHDHLQ